MGIFEDFDDELYQRTGKHFNQLTKKQKLLVLDEAEQRFEQISCRRRSIIRQLRKKLNDKL